MGQQLSKKAAAAHHYNKHRNKRNSTRGLFEIDLRFTSTLGQSCLTYASSSPPPIIERLPLSPPQQTATFSLSPCRRPPPSPLPNSSASSSPRLPVPPPPRSRLLPPPPSAPLASPLPMLARPSGRAPLPPHPPPPPFTIPSASPPALAARRSRPRTAAWRSSAIRTWSPPAAGVPPRTSSCGSMPPTPPFPTRSSAPTTTANWRPRPRSSSTTAVRNRRRRRRPWRTRAARRTLDTVAGHGRPTSAGRSRDGPVGLIPNKETVR